jgi:alpha-1,3-rhamnosyltransferase
METKPLVSVIVVCYNAADCIIETLESVKAQTYKNIELIVSDDCSKDGTSDIANKWLKDNNKSFVRTELITADYNTGVSANYNRAVKACNGVWIKNVDGDDLISENCIQENIDFVSSNEDATLVFSNAVIFCEQNGKRIELGYCITDEKKPFFELEAKEQYKQLLCDNILPSQTCFVRTDVLKSHPYNELYRALEDAPMWVTLTKYGNRAYYFDKVTASYRKNESTTNNSEKFFSPLYIVSMMQYFWNEKVQYIREEQLTEAYANNRRFLFLMELTEVLLNNRRSRFKNWLFRVLRHLIYKFARFSM